MNRFNKWLYTAEEKLGRRKIRRNYPEITQKKLPRRNYLSL